jgi:methionyl aminopeptidase
MAKIKTPSEIKIMRAGGQILKETLLLLKEATHAGTSCQELNSLAGKILKEKGAKPSFLGYDGFPANLCFSLNEELVHGVPGKKIIQEGDLVSYDLGVLLDGLYTDAAITFVCGESTKEQERLMTTCQECLAIGIKMAYAGSRLGDLGAAIQEHAEIAGYSVIRKLIGHGVGHAVHEEPAVPNFGQKGTGERLQEGVCIAIEPMIAMGAPEVDLGPDGWTFIMRDKKLCAHFEHTLAVGKEGGIVLT